MNNKILEKSLSEKREKRLDYPKFATYYPPRWPTFINIKMLCTLRFVLTLWLETSRETNKHYRWTLMYKSFYPYLLRRQFSQWPKWIGVTIGSSKVKSFSFTSFNNQYRFNIQFVTPINFNNILTINNLKNGWEIFSYHSSQLWIVKMFQSRFSFIPFSIPQNKKIRLKKKIIKHFSDIFILHNFPKFSSAYHVLYAITAFHLCVLRNFARS